MNFELKVRKYAVEHFAPWIEDDGPPGPQRCQFQPGSLPDAAANAVAFNGVTQRFRSGESDGATVSGLSKTESGEQGTCVPCAMIVDFSEIAGAE